MLNRPKGKPTLTQTPTEKANRRTLLNTWARFAVYDQTASTIKDRFIGRRNIVIAITLIASVASIAVGVLDDRNQTLAVMFAIVAIVLPLVGTYLMNDTIKVTGTTSWIEYRYTAEMMRMHLYLFRMRAGIYAAVAVDKANNLLAEKLNVLTTQFNERKRDDLVPPEIEQPRSDEAIQTAIKRANRYTPTDDGLSDMTIDDYILWRVDNQRDWYETKVTEDFRNFKRSFRLSQIALLVGSIISALVGLIELEVVLVVAVMNAISVALESWNNVSMIGKTYALFQITAKQLEDQKTVWEAMQDDTEMENEVERTKARKQFVQSIENVLLWEREEWYELALQSQSVGDQMIQGNLTRLTQRAANAQNAGQPLDAESNSG
jgi:hypothetical protein